MITLKKIVVKYRDHYIKSKTKFLNALKNSNNIEGNHKKGTSIWLNEKLEAGTRIILPGFEDQYAFKKFMYLLSKRFGGSDKARTVQLVIENDLPSTSDLGRFQT